MKMAAVIFSMVLLVSVQTPLGQLFKLPMLVEHFLKHQEQNGVSLFAFLQDHYASNHHDADLPEDEQLPFKNISFNNIGYAVVTPLMQSSTLAVVYAVKKIIFPQVYTPQLHLTSIFHPPRVQALFAVLI